MKSSLLCDILIPVIQLHDEREIVYFIGQSLQEHLIEKLLFDTILFTLKT